MGRGMTTIGRLNENPLHAAVKTWYAGPDGRVEIEVGGYVIDVVRADGELVEVQTSGFGRLRPKLDALLPDHRVRVVYPVAKAKWIVKVSPEGEILSRRKSPKAGRVEAIFSEMVSLPQALHHPNFCLDVLWVHAEEIWRSHDKGGKRGWRRGGWIVHDRRLLEVVERRSFNTPEELASLLPSDLPDPFTAADLAAAAGLPRRLAGRMAYCLREMGQIQLVGKQGNSFQYRCEMTETNGLQ